ncbi:CHAT domain-containing protein [Cyathus striatus]|nr:CHAT domain-containing protein [Cyathus striatus]
MQLLTASNAPPGLHGTKYRAAELAVELSGLAMAYYGQNPEFSTSNLRCLGAFYTSVAAGCCPHSTTHREQLPSLLRSLGKAFIQRYDLSRHAEDLNQAVSTLREGVDLTPENDPSLPDQLSYLGETLQTRFERTEEIRDITEAIELRRVAASLTPEGSRSRFDILFNLPAALRSRFDYTHELKDVDDAIERKALDIRPNDPGSLTNDPGSLTNLGNLHQAYFVQTGELPHIHMSGTWTSFCRDRECRRSEEAIALEQLGIQTCRDDDPKVRRFYSDLGNLFYYRSALTRDLRDMHEGIRAHREGVLRAPIGHRDVPRLLNNLGNSIRRLFRTTGNESDLSEAILLYKEAVSLTFDNGPIEQMDYLMGKRWGMVSLLMDPEQALHAFEIIYNDVIPLLAWIGRTMEQRYILLETLANIVSQATAVAIRYGQLHVAVEWLEQGRQYEPSPLYGTRKVAIALEEASMRTNPSDLLGSSMARNISIQDDVLRHQGLAKQWDSLLCQVRSISGFKDFLYPIPFPELVLKLPPSGLVIAVNVDPFSCDALVLTRGISLESQANIVPVRLPQFYERAVILRERLYKLLSNQSARTRTARKGRLAIDEKDRFSIKELLRELWYEIVKPILDVLKLEVTYIRSPRIWWCPTGPLAFLPLHAAGEYYYNDKTQNPGSNIMEYAISSYTPTITALTQSLSKHHQQQYQEFKGLLAVSEPEAPGFSPIPGTALENIILKQILGSFSQTFRSLEGIEATVKSVRDAMPLHSWIHLSCHALQNDSPLNSAFYLHDGQLSLGEIIKQPLPHSQFAFLSACETGKGDKKLSEEAIHLAAGMLAVGYTSVVATMWSISDNYAPRVAEEFYSYILQKEDESSAEYNYPDCTRAASALHHAIGRFRHLVGDDEDGLLLWVPYIHVGI